MFEELDRLLGSERGPNGEPSVNDFLTMDLLPIVDTFADRFDELSEVIKGRPDYRLMISAGVLVRGIAVTRSASRRWVRGTSPDPPRSRN